jgi:hypothetical protein
VGSEAPRAEGFDDEKLNEREPNGGADQEQDDGYEGGPLELECEPDDSQIKNVGKSAHRDAEPLGPFRAKDICAATCSAASFDRRDGAIELLD